MWLHQRDWYGEVVGDLRGRWVVEVLGLVNFFEYLKLVSCEMVGWVGIGWLMVATGDEHQRSVLWSDE